DAAADAGGAATDESQEDAGMKVAGDQRDIGHVAPAIGRYSGAVLVGRLGIKHADASAPRSAVRRVAGFVVPGLLGDVADVVPGTVENGIELGAADLGDVRVAG